MTKPIAKEALQQIYTEARTHHAWLDKPVSEAQLNEIYELMKWGPTSLNAQPGRIVFVKTKEAREKLKPTLMGSNVEQVMAAPVTAIIAYDEKFYEELPALFPAFDARPMFIGNDALIHHSALRDSSLAGAYFMLAVRSLGLDVGPMAGFDNAKVDETFFRGTSWKSNFLCNIGYGDASKLYPRGPRLSFDKVVKIV
jgi:3-hydroxypropanoate dehydrogenase